MADDEISNLSFRDAQKRCKDLGLKAGGCGRLPKQLIYALLNDLYCC